MGIRGRIIVVPQGGIANRMRAITAGVTLGERFGKSVVVVWHRDRELNASFQTMFETSDLPFELREMDDFEFNLKYEVPRKRNMYISALTNLFGRRRQLYLVDHFEKEDVAKIVECAGHDVVINSGLEFADIDPSLINSIFRPTNRVQETKREILSGVKPIVAVQIRRTDNIISINNSPLELFEQSIVAELHNDSRIKIFLATDDQDIKTRLASKYPDSIVFNPKEASRMTESGIVDGLAEMYILSECRRIYGSYWSSFSEMASMIGGNELIVVKAEQETPTSEKSKN
ncbi:MAG: hypothetical protein J1E29_07975 [Duncaniella sp.]|nr:hypothetical protein [Duncaniella sp.]